MNTKTTLNPGWIDLHSHSSCSDGTLSPKELIQEAVRSKIGVFSLTDHDTTAGINEARQEADKHGLCLIPGIEISALSLTGTLHILGYHIDIESSYLQDQLKVYQQARNQRNQKIVDKLQKMGIDILIQEVLEAATGAETVGRPHIAKVLIEKNVISNFRNAFDQYLGKDGKAFVEKEIFTAKEAIEIIHQARGLAFVAHPVSLHLNESEYIEYFTQLKEWGLDGIEVYTSAHNNKMIDFMRQMCARFDFLISGGSDFHGESKPNISLGYCKNGNRIQTKWLADCFHCSIND